MTEISDNAAFYGRYVTKKEKAVPLSECRKIERLYYEELAKNRVMKSEIEQAHRELDNLGVVRKQPNSPFDFYLSGRIRTIK